LKITYVLNALIKGGGERVAVDLANQAVDDGHEVTVIVGWQVDPAILRNELHSNIKVFHISLLKTSNLRLYLNVFIWLCRNRFWLAKQDIIHCHLTFGAVFGSMVIFLRTFFLVRSPAVIETYHSVGMPVSPWHHWLRGKMANFFDAFVLMAKDEYWNKFIRSHPGLLTATIFNGISFKRLSNTNTTFGLSYKKNIGVSNDCNLVVGTISMLRTDRKPWLFLPIFSQISKNCNLKVEFVIVGEGVERDRLKDLIVEYGLEGKVHLPGISFDPRYPLSAMDLFIALNIGSVSGVAALEAAYLGLPVLGIQMNSCYQTNSSDWIWSSSNPIEVASKSIQLLINNKERQLLAEKQASIVRAHHMVEIMAQSYYEIYKQAIQKLKERKY
jgi:glycosyltransferase involved in cell wall biosynthesis